MYLVLFDCKCNAMDVYLVLFGLKWYGMVIPQLVSAVPLVTDWYVWYCRVHYFVPGTRLVSPIDTHFVTCYLVFCSAQPVFFFFLMFFGIRERICLIM